MLRSNASAIRQMCERQLAIWEQQRLAAIRQRRETPVVQAEVNGLLVGIRPLDGAIFVGERPWRVEDVCLSGVWCTRTIWHVAVPPSFISLEQVLTAIEYLSLPRAVPNAVALRREAIEQALLLVN